VNAPAHVRHPSTGRVHLLTSSRLTTWQRCPRAHHYRYEAGIVSVDRQSAALAFGTAIHAGLESWWLTIQAGDPGRALSGALEAAEGSLAPPGTEADPYDLARLTALLCAYDARWQSWACGTEVLAVERAFEYELANPVSGQIAQTWRVAGKIDALLRLADGRVAILEHKTRAGDAGAGSDYRRRLTLDPQISTYFDGVARLGWDADLCIYDVLVKPAIKPLLATPVESRKYTQAQAGDEDARWAEEPRLYAGQRETDETRRSTATGSCTAIGADPDRYLVHAEIVRTEQERESHLWALWHTARQITETRRAALNSGDVRAVPQNSHACFAFGGSGCEYLAICEGTASARDESRFTKLTTVHPELECTAENTTEENH
jgi:RecB family exonuclease